MAKKGKPARAQLPLRIPEAQRARLEKAAKVRGVSMNAEITFRLAGSFEAEEKLGGPRVAALVETIAAAMRSTGETAAFFADSSKLHNQGKWLVHPYAFDQAVKAANTILEYHRPKDPIVEPELPSNIVIAGVGKTKVVPEETIARLREYVKNVGEGMARGELIKRERDDE